MPVVSEAQRRFMYAKQHSPGRLGEVAREFIGASHGIKHLPQHVSAGKPVHRAAPRKPAAFGSLVPESAGHYMGDVPQ